MAEIHGGRTLQDVEIEAFLKSKGFERPESRRQAREVLEREGLTRPGKLRIAVGKLPAAGTLLGKALLRVCEQEECIRLAVSAPRTAGEPMRTAAGATREMVTVSAASCEVCGGSNNRRAVRALARCLGANRIDRVLVVGGTPAQHAEIEQLLGDEGIQLRAVDGARGSHSRRDALPRLEWAQLLVVWGATPLPHKVSKLYTDDPPAHLRVVPLAKRGVEALCREVIRSFG